MMMARSLQFVRCVLNNNYDVDSIHFIHFFFLQSYVRCACLFFSNINLVALPSCSQQLGLNRFQFKYDSKHHQSLIMLFDPAAFSLRFFYFIYSDTSRLYQCIRNVCTCYSIVAIFRYRSTTTHYIECILFTHPSARMIATCNSSK